LPPLPFSEPKRPHRAATLTALAALLLAGCATGMTRTEAPATAASRPADRQEAVDLTSDSPPRTVAATLHLPAHTPASTRRGLPAVVILEDGTEDHSGGIYARALAKAGIAALVTRSDGDLPALLADAAAAWRHLAGDDRFDRRRIGILGTGTGGAAALAAIDAPFPPAEAGPGAAFAAHMPVFPGCGDAVRDWHATDAPVLIVVAEAGDEPPRDACLAAAERLSATGSAVATKVYRWPETAPHRPDLRGNVAADAVNFFEQALKPRPLVF
jgi:chemotaxis response regulator CheB